MQKRTEVNVAAIAQLGERETEDLEVLGSIPSHGIIFATSCSAPPPHGTQREDHGSAHLGLWRSW